jgi:hypothetical protein
VPLFLKTLRRKEFWVALKDLQQESSQVCPVSELFGEDLNRGWKGEGRLENSLKDCMTGSKAQPRSARRKRVDLSDLSC